MCFQLLKNYLKQVDGCPMGGPISVVFSDIFMCKMEFDAVVPAKTIFYKRCVDNTYIYAKKEKWCRQTVWRTKFLSRKYKTNVRG